MKYRWFAIQLVIVCVIVFIFQNIYPQITDQFALVSATVLAEPWTLITSVFLHGSVEHLLYNMIALALFGSILEKVIGGKKFLILFFVSGVISGIGSVFFYTASIGASGAIFGVMGALAALRPGMTIYVSFVPMPMAVAVLLWAAGDLFGIFAPDEVAHAAHLFGLVFGLIVGIALRERYKETHVRRREGPDISEEELEEWEDKWM
jgi:membrane associated rhomboid family serine protease